MAFRKRHGFQRPAGTGENTNLHFPPAREGSPHRGATLTPTPVGGSRITTHGFTFHVHHHLTHGRPGYAEVAGEMILIGCI